MFSASKGKAAHLLKKLKQEHELVQRELEAHRKNADTLNRLHAQGIIDKQGHPMNSKKREQLQD
jgi:SMC interacting uncharacterized protein involved in chromosome segregation